MRFQEVEKIILTDGWQYKNAKGSHCQYTHPSKPVLRSIKEVPMKLTYPACFYPDKERQGAYAVVVPDLPGCVSGGDTLAEAILMGTNAASGWVLDELEDGKPAPEASPLESII